MFSSPLGSAREAIVKFYRRIGYTIHQSERLADHLFDMTIDWDKLSASSFRSDSSWMNSYSSWQDSGWTNSYSSWSDSSWQDSGWYNSDLSWLDFGGSWENSAWSNGTLSSNLVTDIQTTTTTATTHMGNETVQSLSLENEAAIFSANIGCTSWSYVRNMILAQRKIDPAFVRIEEIVNATKHRLPFIGGNDVFDISIASTKCPWSVDKELLLFGLNGKEPKLSTKNNIVFLVDVSGSMIGNWELVQMSMFALLSKLDWDDKITIITYSSETRIVAENLSCGNKERCIDAILSIHADGGYTAGSDALEKAYSILAHRFDSRAINRVMMFTDGDFNFGITQENSLADFIYVKRMTGIYLSVIGFGLLNFHDNNMEALSRNGNGNYCFVGCMDDIYDFLYERAGAILAPIAKDVKVKLEFNPEFIESFRQIGFEVRQLTDEEFHDERTAVDSVGAGHSMIAAFEIQRVKTSPSQQHRRYSSISSNHNKDEVGYVTINYKTLENSTEELCFPILKEAAELVDSKDTLFISFLLAWGMILRDSSFAEQLSLSMLDDMASRFSDDEDYSSIMEIYEQYKSIRAS